MKRKEPPGIEVEERQVFQTSWIGRRSLDHPLVNCELAFAGSNQLYDGTDDGVLTGMEVLGMNLDDTSLVVLSACETGVGKVLNGQGVMGLRQSFRVAGAKSMVMSLWKVSDAATAQLMERFYQELKSGKSSGDALHSAAASLRESDQWSHPAFWSAFLLSGADQPVPIQ